MLLPQAIIERLATADEDMIPILGRSLENCREPIPPLAEEAWRQLEALGATPSVGLANALAVLEQTPESILRVVGLGSQMKRSKMLTALRRALWRLPVARLAEVMPLVESTGTLAPEDRERIEYRLTLASMPPDALWQHAVADCDRLLEVWPDTTGLDDLVDALAPHPSLAETVLSTLRTTEDPNDTMLSDLCLRSLGRWRREEAVDESAKLLQDDDLSDGLFESCLSAVRDVGSTDAMTRMSEGVDDKPLGYLLALAQGIEAIRTDECVALAKRLIENSGVETAVHLAITLATMGCVEPDVIQLQLGVMDDPDIESMEENELLHAMLDALKVANREEHESLSRQLQNRLADLKRDLYLPPRRSSDEDYDDEPATLPDSYDVTMPIVAPEKVGRNDPCPCGSGKKYKKCCGG